MAMKDLRERIREGVFLLDGAMGTELIAAGTGGGCNDYLNITEEDTVLGVHRSYIKAGSDGIITNTFGANKCALERHGLAEKAEQINTAGARIARKAAGKGKYVLGDIGPSGDFLEPLGDLKADELRGAFAAQAASLAEGGVDGFIIETMTALDEATIAVEAVKSVSSLPVFVSMSYDAAGGGFRTMMGVSVEEAVSRLAGLGVDAIGFNCGRASLGDYIKLAEAHAAADGTHGDVVLLAEPNAGLPKLIGERIVYKVSGKAFAEAAGKIRSAGFNILGGCCGTRPAHIKAMAKKLRK
jgi:methionine synthase I (cobalamin-dependent)